MFTPSDVSCRQWVRKLRGCFWIFSESDVAFQHFLSPVAALCYCTYWDSRVVIDRLWGCKNCEPALCVCFMRHRQMHSVYNITLSVEHLENVHPHSGGRCSHSPSRRGIERQGPVEILLHRTCKIWKANLFLTQSFTDYCTKYFLLVIVSPTGHETSQMWWLPERHLVTQVHLTAMHYLRSCPIARDVCRS